jgi:hypothetical protein
MPSRDGEADGVELAAERGVVSPAKWAYTTMFAKHMVDTVGAIVSEVSLTREQPEGIWFGDGGPSPRLGAYRAVALERANAQINVRFKADCPTVAASHVCLLHS